jgi:hypothetical protein
VGDAQRAHRQIDDIHSAQLRIALDDHRLGAILLVAVIKDVGVVNALGAVSTSGLPPETS